MAGKTSQEKKKKEYFPFIESQSYLTPNGTAYLKNPGIALISKPEVDLSGIKSFLAGFPNDYHFLKYLKDPKKLYSAELLTKVAGQTCYVSFGPGRTWNKDAQKYFDNIIFSGHGSVLEHANFSLLLWGVSRSFTHELVRHRAGCEYSQMADYLFQKQGKGEKILSGEVKTDLRKKVQQVARSLLPNETEAPIVVTANVRAWRHMINMRASNHSEIEIRKVFFNIYKLLRKVSPMLFSDFKALRLPDGTSAVITEYPKV